LENKIRSYRGYNRRGAGLAARNIHRLYNNYLTPWFGSDLAKINSYKEVQLWAEAHSSNQALFMADPTDSYSWLSFPRRAYFGNVQHWGYMPLAYISNVEKWREGR